MTSIGATRGSPPYTTTGATARLSRRIQALAIDVLLHGSTLVACMSLLELLGGPRSLAGVAFAAWLVLVVVYEPLLVSRRGSTLGHAAARLQVVDPSTGRPPSVPRAFARYWLKAVSGPMAVLFMVVSPDHQALHDLAAGTGVEERDSIRE